MTRPINRILFTRSADAWPVDVKAAAEQRVIAAQFLCAMQTTFAMIQLATMRAGASPG